MAEKLYKCPTCGSFIVKVIQKIEFNLASLDGRTLKIGGDVKKFEWICYRGCNATFGSDPIGPKIEVAEEAKSNMEVQDVK